MAQATGISCSGHPGFARRAAQVLLVLCGHYIRLASRLELRAVCWCVAMVLLDSPAQSATPRSAALGKSLPDAEGPGLLADGPPGGSLSSSWL